MSRGSLELAFGSGLVAAFNPCGFAMLPSYVSFFVGREGDAAVARPVRRGLAVGALMALGFVLVFGVVGFVTQGLSVGLGDAFPWFTLAMGLLLVAFGGLMLFGRAVKLAVPRLHLGGRDRGHASVFLYGVSYATVSLSCTLPVFLAAIVPTFRGDSFLAGVSSFVAYALGMGAVVVTLTVAVSLARQSVVRFMRRIVRFVGPISGGLLVLTGLYVTYYGLVELNDNVPLGPVKQVTDASERMSRAVRKFGTMRLGVWMLLLVSIALLGEMLRRRSRGRQPEAVSS